MVVTDSGFEIFGEGGARLEPGRDGGGRVSATLFD